MSETNEEIVERLSPLELKIVPFLNSTVEQIKEKTNLDETSLLRGLKFLETKNLLKLQIKKTRIIDLGTNGVYYKKNHLPERRLISVLEAKNYLPIEEAKKISKLSDNEFKVSLGVLKDKALLDLKEGKLFLKATKEELLKKTLEEQFLDILPCEESQLSDEQKFAYETLKRRKDIIEIKEQTTIHFTLTESGQKIAGKNFQSEFVEEVTPEIIKNWKREIKFRKYNIQSEVPKINGGKRHFVAQAIKKGKDIWLELGFQEMTGTKTTTAFWNFDALFQPQDHPARDMHDTFFIKGTQGILPEKTIVESVKKAHENGVDKSAGWNYKWNENEAKKVLLRTHTTTLSAQTLAQLKNRKEKKGKWFAIGKCFRNETLDWSHAFEFNQTEGIVVDKNANFKNLLGYLKEFYIKMGFDDVKFYPSYFPYTEPSVEIYAFHKTKKVWIELGGAGMMRPEVVIPLVGEFVPVLAWGPGFDRILMDEYAISDLRELYENNIHELRTKKVSI